MAIKDVKCYYYQMQAQYLEMKADLADFEQALQDGFITEEQLVAAKEEVVKIKNNYDRLSYIMYLLEVPNRKNKKAQFHSVNASVLGLLSSQAATDIEVILENRSALDQLRKELNQLKKRTVNRPLNSNVKLDNKAD